MKRLFLLLFLLLTFSSSYSQLREFPKPNEGVVAGGLGLNWIDGELYYTFHFTPEISFLNFGVGLDLHMDVNSKGNLRHENFNEFSDYISIIRYLRYGLKNDPLYVKLGALDYYTLGHGSIINNYNNSPSRDARKAGLVFDVDFGMFGFESIYSRFGEAGVAGIRGYARPLQFTALKDIPIIGSFELGASFAADFHDKAAITSAAVVPPNNNLSVGNDEGSLSIVGFDLGLPIIKSSTFTLLTYYDFNKIINFGHGSALGALFQFNGLGLIDAYAKLERRFNGDRYIPSYFNAMYEVERVNIDTANNIFRSKAQRLAASVNSDNGYYGELGVSILGLFDIIGSYARLDKKPNSGILHLSTEIAPEEAPFLVRVGYDKVNIGNENAIFKLDENSYLFSEIGYKPMPYIIVSMVYSWTFTPVRNSNDDIIDYAPQKRIEPRVSFVIPFDLNN